MAFVRVPGNPEPQGAEEIWLEGRGGVRLRAMFAPALAAAGPGVRGSILLAPGRTEFIEKYFEVVSELQARGFCVVVIDWRGQGLSGRLLPNPLKGHFESVDDCVNDMTQLVRQLQDRLPRPHIVLAHSMGGGIMLRALQTRRLDAEGAVFCAPMWGIKSLGDFARGFAKFMTSLGAGAMFSPGVERKWKRERFQKNVVTHDRERFARAQGLVAAEPRLALAGPTLGWVVASTEAIQGFGQAGALGHLKIPVLVVSAGEEELVDNASHEAVVAALPQASRVVVPGARHEIMMETDPLRAQFWAAVDGLLDRLAPRVG